MPRSAMPEANVHVNAKASHLLLNRGWTLDDIVNRVVDFGFIVFIDSTLVRNSRLNSTILCIDTTADELLRHKGGAAAAIAGLFRPPIEAS